MSERRTPVIARVDLAHEPDFALGRVEIRPSRREIAGEGLRESIEPRVMRVLVALTRANGEILSRDDLIASCWDGVIVGEDAINRCISQLRKAADTSGNAFSIETIPRVGYRLKPKEVAEVATTLHVAEFCTPEAAATNDAPEPYPAGELAEPAQTEADSNTGRGVAAAVTSLMAGAEARTLFNHDLLMDAADARSARQVFPAIGDVLDWPKLKENFAQHELLANRAKRQSRASGMTALVLTLTLLWIAVLVPEIHGILPGTLLFRIVALGAGLIAAIVLIFGSRALMAAGTESWLHHRAATERLRQLHFQFLVRRARQFTAEGVAVKSATMHERDRMLELLAHDMKPGVTRAAAAIIDDAGGVSCWLVGRPTAAQIPTARPAALDELFRAYARLRFQHQADYVTKKLAPRAVLWPRQPLSEARRISAASYGLISVVIVCEVSVLVVLMLGIPGSTSIGAALQAVATLAAFGALAMRMFEDGIRPRSEIMRLRNYRGEVLELLRRFEMAAEPSEKLSLMEDMEEASYREVRDFLTLHHQGHLVF